MRTLDKWIASIRNDLSDEEMEAIAMSEAAINMAWDKIEVFMRDGGGNTNCVRNTSMTM